MASERHITQQEVDDLVRAFWLQFFEWCLVRTDDPKAKHDKCKHMPEKREAIYRKMGNCHWLRVVDGIDDNGRCYCVRRSFRLKEPLYCYRCGNAPEGSTQLIEFANGVVPVM